ncbi:MAG: 5-formyltetrahydrofolate cyclo-ligase [Mediterraneibacter gnavus]
MGYGGGFYDTYLQKMEGCHTFGLAFEVQMADQIPAEAHDIRMEYVMTEKRCWKC